MTRRPLLAAALACAAALLVASGRARAYVRYHVSATGTPFHWAQSCVSITAFPGDLPDMTFDQVMTAASGAAAAWSGPQTGNSYLTLSVLSSAHTPGLRAVYDGNNVLVFRHDSWCNTGDSPEDCQFRDPAALALTTLTAKQDGHIVDADIEVNAKSFTWADLAMDQPQGGELRQDLQNALTHEMGHLIGLDHPCVPGGAATGRPLDNLGDPAIDCTDAPPEMRESTMFPSSIGGETNKRTLAMDDLLAVGEMYPLAADPMICPSPVGSGGGSCSASGSGTASTIGVSLIIVVVLLARRSAPSWARSIAPWLADERAVIRYRRTL